jgi:SNF2 family DNA or RNA helicase
MFNFRKLKNDFSPVVVKEGKALYEKSALLSAKIINLTPDAIRLAAHVVGNFNNSYDCQIEIDRDQSSILDSDCDCTYKYDCQHLAALLIHLEAHHDEMIVAFSKEMDLEASQSVDEEQREHLRETFKEAETKESFRQGKKYQKELLHEYVKASEVLGESSFFHSEEVLASDKADLALIFSLPNHKNREVNSSVEIQLALRLPARSKPLHIPCVKTFLDAIRYADPIYLGSKRYFFSLDSFDESGVLIIKLLMDVSRFSENRLEKQHRTAQVDIEAFGSLLAMVYDQAEKKMAFHKSELDSIVMPSIYCNTIEEPLKCTRNLASLQFEITCLKLPAPKILLGPKIALSKELFLSIDEVTLFECAKPGVMKDNTYYRFPSMIKRKQLKDLHSIREMTIPEPLIGTFVENGLGELMRFAEVSNREVIDPFVTLPFVDKIGAECDVTYLNGHLEATLHFVYGSFKVPAVASQLTVQDVINFITPQGVLARNLTEERKIINNLFQDFIFDPVLGTYSAKIDKKIVEFMTEIIPTYQDRVKFNCPENLLEQFIYDNSQFTLNLRESDRVDQYEIELIVEGDLNGTTINLLWECLSSRRPFIELSAKKQGRRKSIQGNVQKAPRTLVLNLDRLAPIVQFLDEIGINDLTNHVERKPLWSLANVDLSKFEGLPITLNMTEKLLDIQKQILGLVPFEAKEIPACIQAEFRSYQIEGVNWLDRLRSMHLNGILADDMGLGKTLQAITILTRYHLENPKAQSIVICPTSLVHNWKEELLKFNPNFKTLAIDGTPVQRKKLLSGFENYDIIITSYTLLQKDIEFYKSIPFGYAILDEAQHIKNRGTRNAQSTKMIQAAHRLILTGTPIENSLDELWSLFDFLMPGLLSTYERFMEKYIRYTPQENENPMEDLRRRVFPFILRRMKKDVLHDLPPLSEIVYHCNLSEVQRELYHAYANSAREELSALVAKEGFERVQIHVLATLTRLKQICCHPAIFAKDSAEVGDSAKYDMLMELIHNLIEGGHKTVIFSQYTRMLHIIREDLQKLGIPFEYLDGASKNRMNIVKNFNQSENIPIFLVSLRAGGSGLNITGADATIRYDQWWNPAVDDQANARVHRIGQKKNVLSYQLITKNTIEERILEIHKNKRKIAHDIISHDEDIMSKLTWEEVLQVLQLDTKET